MPESYWDWFSKQGNQENTGGTTPGESRHEWTRDYIENILSQQPEYLRNLANMNWGLTPSQMQQQFGTMQRGMAPGYERQITDINAGLNWSGMGGGSAGINARQGVRGRQAQAESDIWTNLMLQNMMMQQQGKQFGADLATRYQMGMGQLAGGYQGELMDAEKFWNMLAQGYFEKQEQPNEWLNFIGNLAPDVNIGVGGGG